MRMRTVAVKLLKALRMRSAVLHPFYWVTKPSCLNGFYDLLFTGFFYNRSENISKKKTEGITFFAFSVYARSTRKCQRKRKMRQEIYQSESFMSIKAK